MMDQELTKYTIRRICEGADHNDYKSPKDSQYAVNEVNVTIPYSFLGREIEFGSRCSNNVINAASRAEAWQDR